MLQMMNVACSRLLLVLRFVHYSCCAQLCSECGVCKRWRHSEAVTLPGQPALQHFMRQVSMYSKVPHMGTIRGG